MSDHWLYSQDLPNQPGPWQVQGAEAQHARAKRLDPGETVHLFNGCGAVAQAEVIKAGKGALSVQLISLSMVPMVLPRLTVAVCQPKGERLDWMLEKLTELAVATIIPLECERSVAHVKQDKIDRWQRRLIEAAKQAHVAHLPKIGPPCSLEELLAQPERFTHLLVGDTVPTTRPILSAAASIDSTSRPVLLIGPEGGFSDAERDQMQRAGVQAVSLGETVLRTETAAVVAAGCVLCAARKRDAQ